MKQPISISVVTICFNNLEDLINTIASVDVQSTKPFEHFIINGSTKPEIAEYLSASTQPGYRTWINERDNGIADAFNKGVRLATGNILNMLNAGDKYAQNNVLEIVTKEFDEDAKLQWLHGKFMLQRGGIWVTIGKPFDPSLLYRGMRSLSHQSMFLRSSLHQRYGTYDVSLRNAMDYDFVCRIALEKFAFVSQPLIVFAPGGTTDRDYLAALKEARKVYSRNFGSSWKLTAWQIRLKILFRLLNSPAGKILYKLKVWLKLENL